MSSKLNDSSAVPEGESSPNTKACARLVVETVPAIMRLIRASTRRGELSTSQVRVLSFINRRPGASVSEVAGYLDVTTPTASALVDRLVRKQLVHRQEDPEERRRTLLNLTDEGLRHLESARAHAQEHISVALSGETLEQLTKIKEGLLILAAVANANNGQGR